MPPRTRTRTIVRRRRRKTRYTGYRSLPYRFKRAVGFGTHSFTRNSRALLYDITDELLQWVPLNLVFKLSDVINVSDFTNLFDQFRISKVQLTLRWSPNHAVYNTNNTNQGQGVYNPILYYLTDHNDSDIITNQQNMLEIQKHKSVRLSPQRPVKITVKPAVLAQAYQTAVSTAYGPKWNMKLNMDDNTTPHYGLKMGVSKIGEDFGKISIDVKYHFTCYGVQ